nr:WUSCHEL-related homeobox 3-like [Ipomoea trifida]
MISRPRRWSPTPEQLMVLQELYRKGLRNPNSAQGGDEEGSDMENCMMMRMYGRDWMLMTTATGGMPQLPTTFPCYVDTTPKTLELFPLKSTNMKDDQSSSNDDSC